MADYDYVPINCNLHDRLEALATLRKRCRIVYQTADGEIIEALDTITDVYTKNKEEFATLGSGETTRLDMLIEVDGQSYTAMDSTFGILS
jgi:Rho-binding antiterminator